MNLASTTDPIQFPKMIAQWAIQTANEATASMAREMWNGAILILTQHWLGVTGTLTALFVFFFLLAALGQWGSLYSLTYWSLYAVIVLLIGIVFGPETFVSDWYHAIYLIAIWPVCYWMTGWIWDRFNFRRR